MARSKQPSKAMTAKAVEAFTGAMGKEPGAIYFSTHGGVFVVSEDFIKSSDNGIDKWFEDNEA